MSHPLEGKFIKSNRNMKLEYCKVDGEICYPGEFKMYRIYTNQIFKVKSIDNDMVTLINISNREYLECEIAMDDIEDFKVLSQKDVDALF